MADTMSAEEVRDEAVEVIVRAQSGYVPWCHAEAAVAALAEAGLLPTSVEWAAAGDYDDDSGESWHTSDGIEERMDSERFAERWGGHVERRYVTDWRGVAE
ncbi:hypothetical protein [Nocardia cyriacigeorgica]|uniref:hypothetical protein n=1 Tax=Nocardia cyriacigeorgica TaxID=135487 RepID=UPI00245829F0|nr:hypothetical protein [Nocardia cyriacigeorgica]